MATVAELRMDVDSRPVKKAVTDLDRLENQAEKTEKATDELGRSADKAGKKVDGLGDRSQGAARQMGGLEKAALGIATRAVAAAGALAGVAAAAAAFGTVRVGAGFEEQMSAVLAITQATGDEFDSLSAKARELGATTVFSAKEAAEGMEFLARAGFNANQIIGALPGTLNLAAAGALDLGAAADIASNVLTGFGLAAEEAGRVSDVLAKAAASSNTNVQQLGEGLKFVAPIAAGLGVSMEETTAAIGKLSDAGLQASVAGTGLRRILSEIASPSKELQGLLGGLSLETDGFTAVMKQLAGQSISTGNALEIFGDRGGPAFTVLIEAFKNLDEQGVSSVERLTAALEQADGFAEKTAKTMTDNFSGAVKQAKSALDELFITAADDGGALEGLTAVIDQLTISLRSEDAKNFAETFGNAMRDASYAMLGLVSAFDDIGRAAASAFEKVKPFGDFILEFTGVGFAAGAVSAGIDRTASRFVARGEGVAAFNDAVKSLEDVKAAQATQIEGILTDRKRLFEQIEQIDGTSVTRFEILAEQGPQPVSAETIKSVDSLSLSLGKASKAMGDLGDEGGETGKALQVDFLAGLKAGQAAASRLAEAAAQGKAQFDFVSEQIEIETTVAALAKKAAEAGREFNAALATDILTRTRDLENSAEKLLDAEEKLLKSISETRKTVADGLDNKIDAFVKDIGRVDFADPRNNGALEKFTQRFEGILADFDIESIGLDDGDVAELEKKLKDAGIFFGDTVAGDLRAAADYHADRLRSALQSGLDDLLFNGGKDLGRIFENLARDAVNDNVFRPIVDGEGLAGITKSFENQLKGFQDVLGKTLGGVAASAFAGFQGFEIGKGLSDLVGVKGNKSSVAAGGAAGGLAGFVLAGPIGAAIGAALGTVLGGLLSKPSDNTAQAVFEANTGKILGRDQDGSGANANAAVRDEFLKQTTGVIETVLGLIGSEATNLLNIAVRSDRKTGQSFFDVGNQGPNGEPVGGGRFEATEAGALEAVAKALELTIASAQGGESALLDYAKAASAAGRDVDQIVNGLTALKSITDLTKEPLSDIVQAIKNIDDVIDPVIADLQSLGQSITGIQGVAQDALRALGTSFIDGVRDLNLRLKNDTLANYKDVLDAIAQRQNDAFALFERGAITQGEFDFVQSTGGLQAANFFKTLSDEEKEGLADYLGILGEVSGDISVARARLEEQFDYLIDNVEDTARGFEEAAANFDRLGKGLRETAESIRVQFSGLTPRANVDDLLGRVSALRNDGLSGNASALEALPQVVSSLVQAARTAFGGTAEFARIRDIGLAALDETAGVAEALAKQNYEAAENARTDVELLSDIRNLIDDDRQLTTLQGILDSGQLTNKLIETQLQSFVDLFGQGGRPANEISIEDLQAAATQAILEQQSIAREASSGGGSSTSVQTPTSTPSTDTQVALAIAENATETSRQTGAINNMSGDIRELTAELRRQGVLAGAR